VRLVLIFLLTCPALFARDAELDRVARMLEGTYSSAAQASSERAFDDVRLNIRRVWDDRRDGYWFYVEQSLTSAQDRPVLQRFFHLHRRSDRALVVDDFAMPDPARVAGAWFDTSRIASLSPASLALRAGCAIVLAKKGAGYAGARKGDGCPSGFGGAASATSALSLGDGELRLWDRAFDASGRQVWGATKGPYDFRKVDALVPGTIASTMSLALDAFRSLELQSAIALLDSVVALDPTGADAYAIRAAALRYSGSLEAGIASARAALELSPCHSYAHTVLGDLLNPQFTSESDLVSADSAWAQYSEAVRCDSTQVNAWMGLWTSAMSRDDEATERRAIASLYRNGMFTPAMLAVSRWRLRDLPANAILITSGDLDTYPLIAVQREENIRPDVAVVNTSLMNTTWYPRWVRDHTGVSLPVADDEIDALEAYADDDGRMVTVDRIYLNRWIAQIRHHEIARPLVISTTVEWPSDQQELKGFSRNAGTHYLPGDVLETDTAAIARRLRDVDGRAFAGGATSTRDMSPYRYGAAAPGYAVASAAMTLAYEHLANGERDRARDVARWLRTFVGDSSLAGWDEALAELDQAIEQP
jgi:tetratricopeptide (TPR) repeat protein